MKKKNKPGILWIVAVVVILSLLVCKCSTCRKTKENKQTKVHITAFVASWCESCRKAKKLLIPLRGDGVTIDFIDIDEYPELADQSEITSVPTFLVTIKNKITRTRNVETVIKILLETELKDRME